MPVAAASFTASLRGWRPKRSVSQPQPAASQVTHGLGGGPGRFAWTFVSSLAAKVDAAWHGLGKHRVRAGGRRSGRRDQPSPLEGTAEDAHGKNRGGEHQQAVADRTGRIDPVGRQQEHQGALAKA